MKHKLTAHSIAVAGVMFALAGCGGSDGVDSRQTLSYNTAPTFSSSPVTNALVQSSYSYSVAGTDVDTGDQLTFSAVTLPAWLSFDAASAVLSGTPGTTDIGSHEVVLAVSDGALTSQQSFTIEVSLNSNSAGWQLVWSDEFDGTSLNSENWEIQTGDGSQYGLVGWGNNELQWYQSENIAVAEGMLSITAKAESSNGLNYTSGRMRTLNKVDVRYGRIEARVKAPAGQGLWSAFWMLPTDSQYGGWASGGEIDIMEIVSPTTEQTLYGTAHYGMAWPLNKSAGNHQVMNVTDDFHLYAIEWEQDEIRWYVDDVHFATITSDAWWSYFYKDNQQGYMTVPGAPFNQNFHMLLNLAVGGNWPGSPDAHTSFPATLTVDYVRVYQCAENSETGAGCVNNVNTDVSVPEPASVYVNSTDIYTEGASALSWDVANQTVSRQLQTAIAWDNGGAISLTETDAGGEHGKVLDITTSDKGNVVVNAVDGGTFNLFGMGNASESWKLHAGELKFDLYIDSAATPADSAILIKMDSGWPALGYKRLEVADLAHDQWISVSVPVNDLIATPGDQPLKTDSVLNLFIAEFTAAAHIQLDNIRLVCGHKDQGGCGIHPPQVEIEGEKVVVFDDAVNDTVWTNGIGAWDDVSGADYFNGESSNHVTWSLKDSGDSEHATVLEAHFGSNGANGVLYIQSAQPVNLTDYATGNLIFDIKVLDYAANTSGMTYKVDCIHPCSTGDQSLGVVGNGEWQTVTLPVADLVAHGLNLQSVNSGLVIFPSWGDQQGVSLQLDNIRWEKDSGTTGGETPPPAGGGVSGPLTIYDGQINENWALWDCCGGATVSELTEEGEHGGVAEFTFSSTPTVAGVTATQGHDAADIANGTLEFDLKVVTQPSDTSGDWLIKIEGISQTVFAELKLSQSQEGIPPTTGEWQHFTFKLSDLQASGLTLNNIKIIMIFPTWGTADGAVYRLDNLAFKAN